MTTIDDWTVLGFNEETGAPADAYTPPELVSQNLNGIISGHLNQDPRHNIVEDTTVRRTTSPIVGYDSTDDVVITRSGSRYRLLNVNPVYEAKFPNAKQRLIDSLRDIEKDAKFFERYSTGPRKIGDNL